MKNLLTLFMMFVLATSISFAQDNTAPGDATELINGPKIEFTQTEHDFGEKPQGKPVTHDFTFKNTGNAPLVLQNVKASCGCTTPNWPKEPILPGQEAKISARYNMARAGNFRKSITVTTKGDADGEVGERVVLYIKGNAVTAPAENSVEEAKPSIITTPTLTPGE